jgi:hypothetical protein
MLVLSIVLNDNSSFSQGTEWWWLMEAGPLWHFPCMLEIMHVQILLIVQIVPFVLRAQKVQKCTKSKDTVVQKGENNRNCRKICTHYFTKAATNIHISFINVSRLK